MGLGLGERTSLGREWGSICRYWKHEPGRRQPGSECGEEKILSTSQAARKGAFTEVTSLLETEARSSREASLSHLPVPTWRPQAWVL